MTVIGIPKPKSIRERLREDWSCERRVKVKAVDKDHAEERAETALLGVEPELKHKMHTETTEQGTVEKVARREIETGEYYEEKNSSEESNPEYNWGEAA